MHCSRGLPHTCHVTEYALITWHSCTDHVAEARILQWVVIPFSRGSSQPRDRKLRSSALQVASLPSEPPGKPLKERIISNLCTHFLCFLTSRTEKDSSFSQRKSDLIFGMRENTVLSCPPTSFEVLADQSPMSD